MELILNNFKDVAIVIDIATVVGAVVAGAAFFKGFLVYARRGKQKKAEHIFNLRKKFKENKVFEDICNLLDKGNDGERLVNISIADKRDFLGLFEEVAIMKTSKLIKPKTAYYMFGDYAIKCWNSKDFWKGDSYGNNKMDKESPYWSVFKKFVEDAKKESSFDPDEITI